MSIQIAEISQRLQSALDSSYNVSITKFIMFCVWECDANFPSPVEIGIKLQIAPQFW